MPNYQLCVGIAQTLELTHTCYTQCVYAAGASNAFQCPYTLLATPSTLLGGLLATPSMHSPECPVLLIAHYPEVGVVQVETMG